MDTYLTEDIFGGRGGELLRSPFKKELAFQLQGMWLVGSLQLPISLELDAEFKVGPMLLLGSPWSVTKHSRSSKANAASWCKTPLVCRHCSRAPYWLAETLSDLPHSLRFSLSQVCFSHVILYLLQPLLLSKCLTLLAVLQYLVLG